MEAPIEKRIVLVNRDFQLRYTSAAVIVGVISTLLTAAMIITPLFIFEILRIPRFLPVPVLLVMVLACFVNIAIVGLMGIYITHRVAGPMFSLVRFFRRVESGMWHGEMRTRVDDDLGYVVRNFNEMLHGIRRFAQSDLDQINAAINSPEDREQRLLELRDQLSARLIDQRNLDATAQQPHKESEA